MSSAETGDRARVASLEDQERPQSSLRRPVGEWDLLPGRHVLLPIEPVAGEDLRRDQIGVGDEVHGPTLDADVPVVAAREGVGQVVADDPVDLLSECSSRCTRGSAARRVRTGTGQPRSPRRQDGRGRPSARRRCRRPRRRRRRANLARSARWRSPRTSREARICRRRQVGEPRRRRGLPSHPAGKFVTTFALTVLLTKISETTGRFPGFSAAMRPPMNPARRALGPSMKNTSDVFRLLLTAW